MTLQPPYEGFALLENRLGSEFASLRYRLGARLYDKLCHRQGLGVESEDRVVVVAAILHTNQGDAQLRDSGGQLYLVRVGGAQEQFASSDSPSEFRRISVPEIDFRIREGEYAVERLDEPAQVLCANLVTRFSPGLVEHQPPADPSGAEHPHNGDQTGGDNV